MQHTITTSKGTFLFVGVPLTNPTETVLANDEFLAIGEYIYFRDVEIHIPENGFGPQYLLSTITEDQAREVVSGFASFCYGSIDALRSLMQAERLYVNDPIEGYTGPSVFDQRLSEKQIKENKSRTFPDWLILKVK